MKNLIVIFIISLLMGILASTFASNQASKITPTFKTESSITKI